MSDDDLGKRIEAARKAHDVRTGRNQGLPNKGEGMRVGYRMATDFIAAMLVGAGLGWMLDILLNTRPWMFLVWMMFGFAAGVMGIMRIAKESQTPPGDSPEEGQEDR